jgi:hypothetical protein
MYLNQAVSTKQPMDKAPMAIENAFSRPDRLSKPKSMRGLQTYPVLAYTKAWMLTEHGTGSSFDRPFLTTSALETPDLFSI